MYSTTSLLCGYTNNKSRIKKDVYVPSFHISNFSGISIKEHENTERRKPLIINYNFLNKRLNDPKENTYIKHLKKDKELTLKRIERDKAIIDVDKSINRFLKSKYRYRDIYNFALTTQQKEDLINYAIQENKKLPKIRKTFNSSDFKFKDDKEMNKKIFHSTFIPNNTIIDRKIDFKRIELGVPEQTLNELIMSEKKKKRYTNLVLKIKKE